MRNLEASAEKKGFYDYRIFMLDLVVTLIHEMGHVMVSHLTRGQANTPLHMHPKHGDPFTMKGEMGETLEYELQGGKLAKMRLKADLKNDDQAGLPVLMTWNKDREVDFFHVLVWGQVTAFLSGGESQFYESSAYADSTTEKLIKLDQPENKARKVKLEDWVTGRR